MHTYSDEFTFIRIENRITVVIVVYSDDAVMVSPNKRSVLEMKKDLMATLKMKDLGEVKSFFGVELFGEGAIIL